MRTCPDLPNFSRFHDAFRENPKSKSNEGHMRPGVLHGLRRDNCEFIKLHSKEIDERLKNGPELVSANFVIPTRPASRSWCRAR
jgi:arginine decarboxylase